MHRSIHGNKFSCDVCEKTFAVRSYLSAHMKRIHTGEKRNPHFTCHATEKPTVSEPCKETLSSEQGIRGRERHDSADSDSTVEYLEMERLVPEINKPTYSHESGKEIETEIVADELKNHTHAQFVRNISAGRAK